MNDYLKFSHFFLELAHLSFVLIYPYPFGLDSDGARLGRLFFQPLLIIWALWSAGSWKSWRTNKTKKIIALHVLAICDMQLGILSYFYCSFVPPFVNRTVYSTPAQQAGVHLELLHKDSGETKAHFEQKLHSLVWMKNH